MSAPAPIHVMRHAAMNTEFEVRLAGLDRRYAEQAAQAAFVECDRMEEMLSRYRDSSEIARLRTLQRGERLRVSEATIDCLRRARVIERRTRGAFSLSATARFAPDDPPRWSYDEKKLEIVCEGGRLEFDTGGIGKGFALDRMAVELAEWQCPCFLLSSGGSTVLAGEAPPGRDGWDVGLGEGATQRFWLARGALSGSGIGLKGRHIIDPRTRKPVDHRARAWAFAADATTADALSTAAMVLADGELREVMNGWAGALVVIEKDGRLLGLGGGAWPKAVTGAEEERREPAAP